MKMKPLHLMDAGDFAVELGDISHEVQKAASLLKLVAMRLFYLEAETQRRGLSDLARDIRRLRLSLTGSVK